MRKILLIGGTGCLSTDIARKLCDSVEYELYMLNRGNQKERMPCNTNLIVADIRQSDSCRRILEGLYFDVVVDFISYTDKQLQNTLDILEGHYKQFIFISSAAVYDIKVIGKKKITEEAPIGNKEWWYSQGKIECEKLLAGYFSKRNEVYTIVRPFVTYNEERLPYALAPGYHYTWTIIRRIMEEKPIVVWDEFNCVMPITSTLDFANGIIALFNNKKAYGNIFHIATEKVYSWKQILDVVGNILNKNIHYIHIDNKKISSIFPEYEDTITYDKCFDYYVDNSNIKSVCPEFYNLLDLEAGMKRMVSYHLKNAYAQKTDYMWDARMDMLIDRYCYDNYPNILDKSFYRLDKYHFSIKQKIKILVFSNCWLYKAYKILSGFVF